MQRVKDEHRGKKVYIKGFGKIEIKDENVKLLLSLGLNEYVSNKKESNDGIMRNGNRKKRTVKSKLSAKFPASSDEGDNERNSD